VVEPADQRTAGVQRMRQPWLRDRRPGCPGALEVGRRRPAGGRRHRRRSAGNCIAQGGRPTDLRTASRGPGSRSPRWAHEATPERQSLRAARPRVDPQRSETDDTCSRAPLLGLVGIRRMLTLVGIPPC
jgi:hypothetical protein